MDQPTRPFMPKKTSFETTMAFVKGRGNLHESFSFPFIHFYSVPLSLFGRAV